MMTKDECAEQKYDPQWWRQGLGGEDSTAQCERVTPVPPGTLKDKSKDKSKDKTKELRGICYGSLKPESYLGN